MGDLAMDLHRVAGVEFKNGIQTERRSDKSRDAAQTPDPIHKIRRYLGFSFQYRPKRQRGFVAQSFSQGLLRGHDVDLSLLPISDIEYDGLQS